MDGVIIKVVVTVRTESSFEAELWVTTKVLVVVLSDNVDQEAPVVIVTMGRVVVVVAVEAYTHPIPWHVYPGMQQPPFSQLV